jgi:hypothetical protein
VSTGSLGSTPTLALMGGSLIYLKLLMCGASLRLDKDESSIPPCDPQAPYYCSRMMAFSCSGSAA